jgi:hypothetical protein
MASKKVQNALASTTTPDQILAAAGVEVKLTKSELAEYVKELAIRQLERQWQEADEARSAHDGSVPFAGLTIDVDESSIPARVKKVRDALLESDVKIRGLDLHIEYDTTVVWRVEYADGKSGRIFSYVSIPMKEGEYPIPSKYAEYHALDQKALDLRQKLHEVKNKNFKAMMIENALNSTDAGKLVITNLQQMVEKLTKI